MTASCSGCPADDTVSCIHKKPSAGDLKAADHIVMTKSAALEGTWLLASETGERLRERFPERILETARSTRKLLSVRREAEIAGHSIMEDLAEGGILAALWRLSEHTKKGFRVDLLSVPLLQESIEVAEYYDFDPFAAMSGGCFLAAVPDGDRVKERISAAGMMSHHPSFHTERPIRRAL